MSHGDFLRSGRPGAGMVTFHGVVPARFASTRLPGKALLRQTGKPIIQHVVESVGSSRLIDRVVVATDDKRIVAAVEAVGGQAVLTSPQCRTGTVVPPCRCWMQPTLAEMMACGAGVSAPSRWPSLRSRKRCEISGWSTL